MEQHKTTKNKFLYLGAAVMALVITTAVVAGTTNAGYWGAGMNNGFNQASNAPTNENYVARQAAFENIDYAAWQELMTNEQNERNQAHQKMLNAVTEENFPRFAEMHRLMIAGDIAGAKAISDELGLPGIGRGMKGGRGPGGQGCPHLRAIQN